METIEERAKMYATSDEAERGYIQGATEQKAIDIDKACEWLNQNTDWGERDYYEGQIEKYFREAMEE